MKTFIAAAVASLTLASALPAFAQSIQITPNGATPSVLGTEGNFTGHAVITPLFPANADTRASTGLVTFAPGARTVWHTHPAGQMLIVTSGKGLVQAE